MIVTCTEVPTEAVLGVMESTVEQLPLPSSTVTVLGLRMLISAQETLSFLSLSTNTFLGSISIRN